MVLREFLYVDTEKVRSMLAQIEGGIAEEARETERRDKRTEAGVKGIGLHQQAWGSEEYISKSLGDVIFPTLEEALTADGLLSDISAEVAYEETWTSGRLTADHPAGLIIRVSAPGALFDARYVATVLAGFAAAWTGLVDLGLGDESPKPTSGRKRPRPQKQQQQVLSVPNLEDIISDFPPMGDEQITAKFMRGIVKVARGLFAPGLHLNLVPTSSDHIIIGARLQEGRAYLDSDPDVLFARYGLGLQEWTLVGSIGHYAENEPAEDLSEAELTEGDNLVRGRTARYINAFMNLMGGKGFTDIPQFPGFSVVPFAVYRTIPKSVPTELQLGLGSNSQPSDAPSGVSEG
jgi:hypothetical protein